MTTETSSGTASLFVGAILFGLVVGILTAGWVWTDPTGLPHRTTVITEDMPGWDCHTMGNMICGKGDK